MRYVLAAVLSVLLLATNAAASEDWMHDPSLYYYENINDPLAKEAYLKGLLSGYLAGIQHEQYKHLEDSSDKYYEALKNAKKIIEWAYTQKNAPRASECDILYSLFYEVTEPAIKKELLRTHNIRADAY